VPTGTAFFGASAGDSSHISTTIGLGGITFNPDAQAYSIVVDDGGTLSFNGTGIVNNSANTQTLNIMAGGAVSFGSGTLGDTSVANRETLTFRGTSDAGSATIANNGGGTLNFRESSTARDAAVTNLDKLNFFDSATTGNANVINSGSDAVFNFRDTSTAGNAEIRNTGGAKLNFRGGSTAGNATITNDIGSTLNFFDTGTAGNASITSAGAMNFIGSATAGNSTITTDGSGILKFMGSSSGGTARYIGNGASTLDISGLTAAGMAIGSVEGAGTIALGAKQLTVGGNDRSATQSGSITGVGGSLVKTGNGTLTLTGNNAYTGGTTVAGGGLVVNGALASGVVVEAAGALGGSGTINGDVGTAGLIAPGNSIGTLKVVGNYTQAAGSVYQVEVNAAGQSDLIDVTGHATISGGSVVLGANGTYRRNTTYTILTASAGVDGAYGAISSSSFAFLTPTLSYDADNVFLSLRQTQSAFADGGQTGNQKAVGFALDRANGSATGDFNDVLDILSNLDTTQGPKALDAIGGQQYSGFGSLAVAGAQAFMNTFSSHAGGGQGGGQIALAEACDIACDVTSPKWGGWGGGLGSFGTIAGDRNAPGTSYSLGGFAAGLDYRVAPDLVAGVTIGYSSTMLHPQGMSGQGTSSTVQAGLYGEYNTGTLYVDGLAGYAHSDNRMTRQIQFPGLFRTAQGQTHADQFFGQLETGYKISLGFASSFVTPFGRLQGTTSTQAGFTETGADSLNLNVAQQTTTSLRSVFGAQLGGEIENVNLTFRLGWSHEYADTSRPVTASFAGAPAFAFTTQGAQGQRDGAVLGLAADTRIGEQTSLYLRYDGDLMGDNTSNTISGGVRMVW
jgi:outer membrane autotransporter protein